MTCGATDSVANLGAAAIRAGFDETALARWLTDHVAGYAGPLIVEQFRGGQSNPTYRLTTPGARYVLRRKPPGGLCQSNCTSAAGRAGRSDGSPP